MTTSADIPEQASAGQFPFKFTDLPEEIQQLFDHILNKYDPADGNSFLLKKTTVEIYNELQNHCAYPFPIYVVFKFLLDNEFTFDTVGNDMEFYWFMKAKENMNLPMR